MTQILNYLLSFILIYGYPTVVGVVLLGDLGIPLPVTSVLLAAGSFTAVGILNIYILIPLVTITVICIDVFGYYVGWKLGYVKSMSITGRMKITASALKATEQFLEKHGTWCVFLSRWLITPLGVPVNIIAGIHRYSFKKFVIWAAIGELLWAGLYIYLGYLFGVNWQSLVYYLNNTPELLAAIVIGVGLLFMGVRIRRNHKHSSEKKEIPQ